MTVTLTDRVTPLRPLGETELEVLESIYAHRLLSTTQLWQLHTPAGQTRTPRWMQQVLSRLARRGLVAWVRRRGHPRLLCWYVTDAGADTIETATARPRGRRVLVSPHGAAGMLQAHTLAVNDVGLAFACWARRLGHECGHLAWDHELAHRVGDGRGPQGGDLLIADALVHYAANIDGRVTLISRFVELDRATMSTQQVGDKLRRYVTYGRYVPRDRADGRQAWRERYPSLPGVLVVLTGKPRRRLLARRQLLVGLCRVDPVIRDADAPSISIVLLDDLQRHGPFTPIFCRPAAADQPVDLLGRTTPGVQQLAPTGTEGQWQR